MDANEARTILLQKALSYEGFAIDQDGQWGNQTSSALLEFIRKNNEVPKIKKTEKPFISSGSSGSSGSSVSSPDFDLGFVPPKDNTSALSAFYGSPSKNFKYLTVIELPYQMVLAWDTSKSVSKISCHKKAAPSLLRILSEIEKVYGRDGILEHGLHLYGGCYNHRRMRGGSSWSRHAWGIAIDINPDENGLRTPWRADKIGQKGYATMPVKVIEIFEKYGWKSYAKSWGKDAMHSQLTQ